MTRLVLLGAGTSFGSGDVSPSPPPLAAHLFDALASRPGVASSLSGNLQAAFRKNFEIGMAQYFEDCDGDVLDFQRELALYLAEFEPGANNMYVRLIKELGINRCVLCTLNYDLLIELSAFRCGYGVTYGPEYRTNQLRLLKPHGSCNFWPEAPGLKGKAHFAGLVNFAKAAFEFPVSYLTREETLERCRKEETLSPAIAVFADHKRVIASPSCTDSQRKYWQKVVSKASRICVSGVNVHLQDTHIWEPLSQTKAAVFYFGLHADRDSFGRWQEKSKKRNMYFRETDFANAIPEIARIMMRVP